MTQLRAATLLRLARSVAIQIGGGVFVVACSGSSPFSATGSAGGSGDTESSGGAAGLTGGGSAALPSAGSSSGSSAFGGSGLAESGGSSGCKSSGAGAANGGGAPGDGGALGGGGSSTGLAGSENGGSSPSGGQTDSNCAAAFCEDFESGKFDPGKWTLAIQGANTASVQSAKSAHGKYAALFHYAGTRGTWAMALAKALPASLATHHFGRANVLLQAALANRHAGLVTAGTTGFPTYKYLEVASVGSTFQLTFVDLRSGGGESYASGGTIPNGRWFCMTWEFNDAPDGAKVSVDGVQAFAKSPFTFNGKSTGLVGGFTDLAIGFRFWGAGAVDPANDLYYDDLALDPQPLACTK
jgi:hypothetical protein